jgi:hypothetical protein
MTRDGRRLLPRKYSYAIGLAASLKEEFNGDGAVVFYLALQLRFLRGSESMGNHDSKIVDAGSVD